MQVSDILATGPEPSTGSSGSRRLLSSKMSPSYSFLQSSTVHRIQEMDPLADPTNYRNVAPGPPLVQSK